MIEVRGRPILEHNMARLAAYGFRDVIVNMHHRPETIVSHFGAGGEFGVRIIYSYEPALLGTAGALNPMREILDETFLVVYGDNLSTCRFDKLVATHRPGDVATAMPSGLALASTWDPQVVYDSAAVVGDEARRRDDFPAAGEALVAELARDEPVARKPGVGVAIVLPTASAVVRPSGHSQ